MGHYRTFDAKHYDFKGHCEYTLLEQIDMSKSPKLYIAHRNNHGLLKDGPTELTVRVMKTYVLVKQNNIYVNSQLVSQLPYGNSDIYIKKSSEFFYSLEGKGFNILFDGVRIYITLDPMYIDNVRGLCGTFNFKSSDDFLPPSGFIESDVFSFVDSYKTDISCETPKQNQPCENFIAVRIFF